MDANRPLHDLFAELAGADRVTEPTEVLRAGGHDDLSEGLVAEAVVNYADTAPIEVTEHLSAFVRAHSPVPTVGDTAEPPTWLDALATAPTDIDPAEGLDEAPSALTDGLAHAPSGDAPGLGDAALGDAALGDAALGDTALGDTAYSDPRFGDGDAGTAGGYPDDATDAASAPTPEDNYAAYPPSDGTAPHDPHTNDAHGPAVALPDGDPDPAGLDGLADG